jgi:hypothetical protein
MAKSGKPKAPSPKKRSTIPASETYASVQKLVADGMGKTAAIARVAESTNRTPAAVTTAYYQYARSLPDGGGVRQTRRTPKGGTSQASHSAASGGSARLAREASRVMSELVARVEELEHQAAADAAELKRLRRILSKV